MAISKDSAVRKEQQVRHYGRKRGIQYPTDLVPIGPALEAINAAVARGLSGREICRLTGLGDSTLWRYIHHRKPDDTLYRKTRDKVVRALQNPEVRAFTSYSLVDPKKARQIVHSLSAQGFTVTHQAWIIENNTGESGTEIIAVNRLDHKKIYKSTEDKALWLARILGDARGPSQSTMVRSLDRGFFPLKHYNVKGDLIVSSLSTGQRAFIKRV